MKTLSMTNVLALAAAFLLMICGGCKNNDNDGGFFQESFLLVANSLDDTVTVIRDSDKAVVATVMLTGDFPWEIALSTDQTLAYVSNRDSNSLSVVDIASGMELAAVTLTTPQPSRALVAGNGFLYVVHAANNVVTKVDISGMAPVEMATIPITASRGSCIAESLDGQSLYVGSENDLELCKIDLNTETEVSAIANIQISDFKINGDGIAFVTQPSGTQVFKYDTLTDTWLMDTVGMTTATMEFTELVVDNGRVFVASNAPTNSGGVAEFAVDFDQTNFLFDSSDDDFIDLVLPFTFSFQGMDYTTVSMNSNGAVGMGGGYVDYDTNIESINGFATNTEDLDSSSMFNYTSRTFADRAVFNWHTSCNFDEPNANFFYSAEIVIYANGSARFSYLNGGPGGGASEDEGFRYGVGDGTNALVDLRAIYGIPFDLVRTSLFWDPANPNVMTPIPFEWEGTGLHFSPAIHAPEAAFVNGVAVTSTSIYMATPVDYQNANLGEIVVYDRATMIPTAPIAVGAGPIAIVRAQP